MAAHRRHTGEHGGTLADSSPMGPVSGTRPPTADRGRQGCGADDEREAGMEETTSEQDAGENRFM